MNETASTKYGVSPENVENKTIDSSKDSEFNREMYDFLRVKKVANSYYRNMKYDTKKDRRQKRLRNPLFLDEKVENNNKIEGRFLRQELFALDKQFEE